jgi:hypothetical protein
MEYTIYKLTDPNTLQIMYIGITTKTIYERLSRHITESYYRKRHFSTKNK